MKKTLFFGILIVVLIILIFVGRGEDVAPPEAEPVVVTSFEECVAAGNPVMESYPEQCRSADGQLFTRDVGNEIEKMDLIRIDSPRPGDVVTSPLTITGEARGYWYFEATFPIQIVNWDGLIIGESFATANGEWMTEDFVPFSAEITFEKPIVYPERGWLILQKSNASGLPEHDDALEIPIKFE